MTLERRYRRRLRMFPRSWRAAHEEAILGLYLDAADHGNGRVPFLDTLDLARSAAVVRLRLARRAIARRATAAGTAAALVLLAVAIGVIGAGGRISPEFLTTSLIVVLVPGTGVVYTVSSALGGGARCGIIAAVGCTLGIVPHMVAAMLGLSGVMQAGAAAFEVVRWVGVAYLAFMGVSMIRSGGALRLDEAGGTEAPSDRSAILIVRRGVLLNVLNPKLTVFFFAFLPQFLDASPRVLDPGLVVLGVVFMLITFVVFVGYAYASATVRERVLRSSTAMRWIQRTLGTLLLGFAARLAAADR